MSDIESDPLAVVKVKEKPGRPQSITVRKRRLNDCYIYRVVNAAPLRIGDQLRVTGTGVKLDVSGPLIILRSRNRQKDFIACDTGTLKIVVQGKPRSRVEIPVVVPPAQDPLGMDLCGPGLYRAHADLEGKPLRFWVDRVAEAGMNYIRVIIPARAWLDGTPQSIFKRLPDGSYDIETVDEEYLRRLRADLWYARRRGVVIHVDLFDWHILRHMPSWRRSEFCGLRNTLGYPLPSMHYIGRWENAVEHPLKADWDYPSGSAEDRLQRRYADAVYAAFRSLAEIVPAGHIIGDGNELEGRTVSRCILDHVRHFSDAPRGATTAPTLAREHDGPKALDLSPCANDGSASGSRLCPFTESIVTPNLAREHDGPKALDFSPCANDGSASGSRLCLGYGGTPLWADPRPPETWDGRVERLSRDPLTGWIRYLCLHGASRENVALRFRRLLPLLETNPHLRVLFSTDGTGTGTARGKEGRPTFDELLRIRDRCRQVAGDRYAGFGDIKTLGLDDARALLAFWSRYGA